MNNLYNRSAEFKPGSKLGGRYQIIELIGSGSIGLVLRVSDLELEREIIALKILHRHFALNETALTRFQNEVIIARQLSHPNIVRVFDFEHFAEEDIHFISMECVDGPDLRQYLDIHKEKRLPWKDAIRILSHISSGLALAHRRKILHRDITPANILLDTDGQAKLADFGIAQSLQISHGLTATGESLGTPQYMSPEQFSGVGIGPQSDLYSLGVVAYELVSGTLPFRGDNYLALANQHLQESLPMAPLESSSVPQWYQDFVCRCCEKKAVDRFQSCDKLLEFIRLHAANTLERPRLKLKKNPLVKPLLYRHQSFRTRVFLRTVIVGISLIFPLVLCLEANHDKPRRRLLAKIFQLEEALGAELPLLKSVFGFPDYSLLREGEFFRVVGNRSHNVLAAMLRAGADPNIQDDNGNTAFHHMAQSNWSEGTEVSLSDGYGDPEILNNKGDLPLFLAIRASHWDLARTFVYHRSGLSYVDKAGNTGLHLALRAQNRQLAEQILDTPTTSYISYWQKDGEGDTVLHIAVENEDIVLLRKMLEKGLYPDVRDAQGRTPLMLALRDAEIGQRQMVVLLRKHGAEVDAKDRHGNSVFSYASTPELMELLRGSIEE